MGYRFKKYVWLNLFIFCLGSNSIFSQQNIDSLTVALKQNILDSNRVKNLNRLSWALRSIDTKKAMVYAVEAKKLSEKISFERGRGDAFNNIGVLHYRRGEYIEATKAQLQALATRTTIGDKEGEALSYINLGNIYSDQHNNQQALDNYLHAAKLLSDLKDTKLVHIIYLNIGAVFLSEKKYAEGFIYCEKARVAAIANKDSVVLAEALNNIGIFKESENNFGEALAFYLEALKISTATGDKIEKVDNMINVGNMHRMLKNVSLAIKWHTDAETLARELGYLEGLKVLYDDFSKDYQAIGKFETALNYQLQFKQLSDSLFNDENTYEINDLTEKWQNDRQEKDLIKQQEVLLQAQEDLQLKEKRLWVIGSGAVLLMLFLGYVLYANSRLKRANLVIATLKEQLERGKKL